LFLIASLLSLVPSGRTRAADPVTAPALSARIAMTTFSSLDPVSLPRDDQSARDVAENLFVGLTRYDPASGQIQPALARAWNVSGDGLTWTFNLRSDVVWVRVNPQTLQVEPVRPVVANDFVYAIRRACDPQPPNPEAHTVYIIAGCRKVALTNPQLADEPYIAREVAVTAPNDQTLEIKLAFPAPYFASIAALPELRPLPAEIANVDWMQPGVLMTDGPWAVAAWTRGQQMTLVRNPLWPDKPSGSVEQVVIDFVESPGAALQQFTSGSADFVRLDAVSALSLRQTRPDAVVTGRAQSVTVLGFSAERTAAANLAFRRAASQAIDRDKLVAQLWPGLAVPMSQFIPPDATGIPSSNIQGFAPDAAKAALVASGMPTCKPAEKLEIMVDDQPPGTAIAQAVLDQWQAILGCSGVIFKITVVPVGAVQNAAHGTVNADVGPRPHLWIYTWTPDYADANAWLDDALHCQYGFLRPGIACGDADRLVDAAAADADPAKRADEYQQAEMAWFGPAGTFPVAPLYALLPAAAVQPALKGVTVDGAARFDLWSINP
jgi:oligopeptide transport system substrate-binding protein